MDLALSLLLLWGLLFVPIGMVLHWLVLGAGARVRALPLAPVSGVALGLLTLAALGRFGIEAGEPAVAGTFVVVSLACVFAIWRGELAWRSRELLGAGALLLLAMLLVQLPVVGEKGDGPLGYGTAADPVAEVAAIDAAADGPAADLAVSRQARDDRDERPVGFEQFAALTVGIGQQDDPRGDIDAEWTAYGLHATITGMLAALVTLPLFAFARARGVRWLGLVVLVPLGVLAPSVFLALANGEGAAIASVPFTTAAVFSLLVTRRDRGWWALVVLFGAAIAATAGPLALLPLVMVGVAWMFLRSDTYEHLSQHDTPVAQGRTLAVTAVAVALGVVASWPLLDGGGELLAWSALHTDLRDAVRSWPFAWLDSDLSTAGPRGVLETAIWLIGPALLAVAAIYAVVRNERRELGVLAGAVAAALVAAGIGLLDEGAGIRLFEFVMLSTSPFLAALAVRAVALARENAEDVKDTRGGRLAGVGPTALVVVFVLLSFAATAVTGTRMNHAPQRASSAVAVDDDVQSRSGRSALIAAGDPWLEFDLDGERVEGDYADADAVSEVNNEYSQYGTRVEGYDQLVFSSSPLSSDPSLRYLEQDDLDSYQVRLFRDRFNVPAPTFDGNVDPSLQFQRVQTQVADRPGAEDADGTADAAATPSAGETAEPVTEGETPAAEAAAEAAEEAAREAEAATPTAPRAALHVPVEGAGENTPPDRPAGLLVPDGEILGCGFARDVEQDTCEPTEPRRGPDCTDEDVAAAQSPKGRAAARADGGRGRNQSRPMVLRVDADGRLPFQPTMIGVQCFDVPLREDSSVLLVHLRDVGLILAPEQAEADGPGDAWETEREEDRKGGAEGVNGGVRRVTSDIEATLTFGGGRLLGSHDLVLEGEFGSGVAVESSFPTPENLPEGSEIPPVSEVARFVGSADGFSMIARGVSLSGNATVSNVAGTDIEIGRLFARPRDLPRSCDVPIAIAAGEQREVRVEVPDPSSGPSLERPGLTVTIVDVTGSGSSRAARVAVGSYLSEQGLPRHTLVDWTEQFTGELSVEGCDGVTYTEEGAATGSDDPVGDDEQVEAALGGPSARD